MRSAYADRKVFVTGHSGFKGQHLIARLRQLGAETHGYSLPEHDVRNYRQLRKAIHGAEPDFVFHLAAQAFVPCGYTAPLTTYETNVLGTVNLLEAVRHLHHRCAVVVVTTDKVYGSGEDTHHEDSLLIPHCPYSASKIAAEHAVSTYRDSYDLLSRGIAVATARAGNVIGPGDWGEGRLVPNAVRALRKGEPIRVFNPYAIRPWQYVSDVIDGYLRLGAKLAREPERYATAWNFGPNEHHSVREVVEQIMKAWVSGVWVHTPTELRETLELRINSIKAREELDWYPRWEFEAMISETISWYKEH